MKERFLSLFFFNEDCCIIVENDRRNDGGLWQKNAFQVTCNVLNNATRSLVLY